VAWIRHDPYALQLAIKSSKEVFSTNKVEIGEETTITPTLSF
jgi:hypothetical protein